MWLTSCYLAKDLSSWVVRNTVAITLGAKIGMDAYKLEACRGRVKKDGDLPARSHRWPKKSPSWRRQILLEGLASISAGVSFALGFGAALQNDRAPPQRKGNCRQVSDDGGEKGTSTLRGY